MRQLTRRGITRRLLRYGRGVYIVGMHRSGTSAITRTVNLMGVPLSDPKDLVGAVASSNPTGHWESGALLKMNDRILTSLGGAWSAPPIMPPGWERGGQVAHLRREAGALFGDTYRTRQWVWKDPRLCLTLPFWRAFTPARAMAILVVRHPVEIAHSLKARNGFPESYSLALWERYLRTAIDGVIGLPILVTMYDDLLRDPVDWSTQVSGFLARNGLQVNQPDARVLATFLDPGLRHSASGLETLDAVEGATDSQRRLFETLLTLAGRHEPMTSPTLPPEAPGTEALLAAHRLEVRRTGDQWLVPTA